MYVYIVYVSFGKHFNTDTNSDNIYPKIQITFIPIFVIKHVHTYRHAYTHTHNIYAICEANRRQYKFIGVRQIYIIKQM